MVSADVLEWLFAYFSVVLLLTFFMGGLVWVIGIFKDIGKKRKEEKYGG